ncbi:MAG: hypothetical protein ACE5E8_09605 [Acidimicrobiia bacterium]
MFGDSLATSGTFTAGQFDEIMSIVDGEEKVVFVKGEKSDSQTRGSTGPRRLGNDGYGVGRWRR